MAAAKDLSTLLQKLRQCRDYASATPHLSQAKLALLKLSALTPTPTTPAATLLLAREVFEIGAILAIQAKQADVFTRYVAQLRAFYELGPAQLPRDAAQQRQQAKVTGLHLLLLLTKGDYAAFHTELEGLDLRAGGVDVEGDKYLGYPVKLERWLMEGSYDRVWKAMASGEVPSEEYSVFTDILTTQIRSEIAACSERAYPSLPISSASSLLFLPSEGAVIQFAHARGWLVRDGRIYFPRQQQQQQLDTTAGSLEDSDVSKMAIENTLGYARELETIV